MNTYVWFDGRRLDWYIRLQSVLVLSDWYKDPVYQGTNYSTELERFYNLEDMERTGMLRPL